MLRAVARRAFTVSAGHAHALPVGWRRHAAVRLAVRAMHDARSAALRTIWVHKIVGTLRMLERGPC